MRCDCTLGPLQPVPFPQSLFDQGALIDENVRWTRHECKSYECLNTRLLGDCRNCFMLFLEKRRWRRAYRGSLPMHEVIAMKNGSLRYARVAAVWSRVAKGDDMPALGDEALKLS